MVRKILALTIIAIVSTTMAFAQTLRSSVINNEETGESFIVHVPYSLSELNEEDDLTNEGTEGENPEPAEEEPEVETDGIFTDNFEYDDSTFAERWSINRSTIIDSTIELTVLSPATPPSWILCKPESFYNNGLRYIHTGDRSAAIGSNATDFTWLIGKDTIDVTDGDTLTFWMYYLNNPPNDTTHFHVAAIDASGNVHLLQSWGSLNDLNSKNLLSDEENGEENPEENGDDPNNSSSNLYENIVAIPLDELKDNRIQLAFIYENKDNSNSGNNLAIDNITIGTPAEPDLILKPQRLPYSKIPLLLTDTMSFSLGAYIQNIGADLQDSITLSVSVPKLDINWETIISDSIQNGETEYFSFPEKVTFRSAQSETFEITYNITNGTSNLISEATTHVSVTPNMFATDYGVIGGLTPGLNTIYGNRYPIERTAVATGVEIGWQEMVDSTLENATAKLHLLQQNPIDNSVTSIYTQTIERRYHDTTRYYKIDEVYLTPGFRYIFALERLPGSSYLGIGIDRSPNGSFWGIQNNDQLTASQLTNPNIGNLAIRALISYPTEEKGLNLEVTSQRSVVENAIVSVAEVGDFPTDEDGIANIPLENNGEYFYTVSKDSLVTAHGSAVINNTRVTQTVDLKLGYEVTIYALSTETNEDGGVENPENNNKNGDDYDEKTDVAKTNEEQKNDEGEESDNGTKTIQEEGDGATQEPEPIQGLAGVEIYIANQHSITDDEGKINKTLAEGQYTFIATKKGYARTQVTLTVSSDTTITFDIDPDSTSVDITFSVTSNSNDTLGLSGVMLEGYGRKLTTSNGEATFTGVTKDMESTYSVSKYGYIAKSGTVSAEEDTIVEVSLAGKGYDIIFEVLSGTLPVQNAQIDLTGYGFQTTSIDGFALFKNIDALGSVPYEVSNENFIGLEDTLSLWHSNIKLTVRLDSLPNPPEPPTPTTPTTDNSVETASAESSLLIYPNPTNGSFTVERNGMFDVLVMDLTGRTILNKTNVYNSTILNITSKPAGIYLVRIIANGEVSAFRVIKR